MMMNNMDYELCKKLKDAGFPQMTNDHRDLLFPSSKEEDRFANSIGESWLFAYNPTLSELIEACGDRFHMLLSGWSALERYDWDIESSNGMEGKGSTPEEAVANLWLELNKKSI